MSPASSTDPSPWRFIPLLTGIVLAPLLFGSVNQDGQAVVGICLGLTAVWVSGSANPRAAPLLKPRWLWLMLVLLILPLIPLPAPLVHWVSPGRWDLARAFPVDSSREQIWIPLTASPAATAQRLAEISILIAGFVLSRLGARTQKFSGWFAAAVGIGILLLAASDIWFRMSGRKSVLGLWQSSWGEGAGTFANRNHFANWINVGSLFVLGWTVKLLRSTGGSPAPLPGRGVLGPRFWFLAGTVLFGIGQAMASGSRAGFISFLAGLGVWVCLCQRFWSRHRGLLNSVLFILAVVTLLLFTPSFLVSRFSGSTLHTFSNKATLWSESLKVVPHFPVVGSGPGSFVTVLNHYKTVWGDTTLWHAENEYIQWLVEMGLAGTLAALVLLAALARAGRAAIGKSPEPELACGAVAALAAFAVHAAFEFVLQIPATALLAASIAGLLVGLRDRAAPLPAPEVLPRGRPLIRRICAWAFLALAMVQGISFYFWAAAKRTEDPAAASAALRKSLLPWPWPATRQIALVRAEALVLESEGGPKPRSKLDPIRARLISALGRDPFNWELRLELVWFDASFLPNADIAVAEAWTLMRLSPLQKSIPITVAGYFSNRKPDVSWQLLRAGKPYRGQRLFDAFSTALALGGPPSRLWELTVPSPDNYIDLGNFAVGQKLFPLAVTSFQLASNHLGPLMLARKLLQAQQPALALVTLTHNPLTARERVVRARAHLELKDWAGAFQEAEAVLMASPAAEQISTPVPSLAPLERQLERWRKGARYPSLAVSIAEQIFEQPVRQRDIVLLATLVSAYPEEHRIAWILIQTHQLLDLPEPAARQAVDLADRISSRF